MLGLNRNEVRLVTHHDDWSNQYQNTKKEIQSILGDNLLGIYHIGSTAVKNIAAKPILDIAVTIKSIERLNFTGMESVGYVYSNNRFVTGDYLFVKYNDEHHIVATHHVHCYLEGHENLKDNILFCNYLNEHPEIAKQYNDLKLNLSSIYASDRVAYTEGKTDFIKKITAIANDEFCSK